MVIAPATNAVSVAGMARSARAPLRATDARERWIRQRHSIHAVAERAPSAAHTRLTSSAPAARTQAPSASDLAEMRRINAELKQLKDAEVVRLPIHPTRSSIARPGSRRNFGSIGEAILDGLGGAGGFQAAFDGTSGGTAAPSWFRSDLQAMPRRRLYLRDLIPSLPVSSDKVDYVRQTVSTQNAAAVAVGALKPTSTYTIERVTATVSVIAHITEAIDRSLVSDYDDWEETSLY